jgi:hypothetical protein
MRVDGRWRMGREPPSDGDKSGSGVGMVVTGGAGLVLCNNGRAAERWALLAPP